MAALVLPQPGSQFARFCRFLFLLLLNSIIYIYIYILFLILGQFGNVEILVLVRHADGDISSLSGLVVFIID